MSKISINLIWSLKNGALAPGKYSNEHKIEFNENTIITGDSAPDWKGDPNNSNPEQTLAASLNEDSDTIMDVWEPFLLQLGFLERTPRGRVATRRAYDHLGLQYASTDFRDQGRFDGF